GTEGKSWVELSEMETPQAARDHVGIYLAAAEMLGQRTAEMHLALASETADPAFAPEPLGREDLLALAEEFRRHAARVLDGLKGNISKLPDEVVESAGLVLSRRRRYLERFKALESTEIKAQRIRIHGDFHLGQVLRVRNDYVILDFEGEPARSLAER